MVGFGFYLQIFGPVVGPFDVDSLMVLLGGGGDTSTLHGVIKLILTFALGGGGDT